LRKAAPFFWVSGNSGTGASHRRIMSQIYFTQPAPAAQDSRAGH
jgi:hypothetical protein